MVLRQRLRIRNIERGAADLAFLEGFDEGGLVDDAAAGDVGDVGAVWVGGMEEVEFGG